MNWKKALAAGTLAVAAVTMIAGCGGNTDKQAAQKLPDKIVIGLDDNFPPMGFRDDSGQLVGFDIDLAQEASKRLGIPVEFKPIDWDSKEAALKSKQVDMLWNGLTITDERSQQIAFSKPYMNNAQLLVVRADSPVSDRAGLAGKVIGTQEGSSSIDALEKNAEFKDSLAEVKKYGDFVNASWTWKSAVPTASSSTASSAVTTWPRSRANSKSSTTRWATKNSASACAKKIRSCRINSTTS